MYNRKSRECITKPAFRKADYSLINAFLGTVDWNEVYSNCHTMNDYWIAYKGILNTVIYNFVPFVQCSKQKCAPWFNNYLKRLRSIKQRRWKKYTKTRNIVSHNEYKEAATRFRTEFMSNKKKYEKNLFTANNTLSKFYGYVKTQTTANSSIPCIQKTDREYAITDEEKANEFSEYFSSVFVNDNNIIPAFEPDCVGEINRFHCSVMDVIKAVRKLKSYSSPGPDGVTGYFLKNILAHIAGPLCKVLVFQMSLTEGSVPDDWKTAFILPLHKKGNHQCTSNYRPVSLTSVICKVLERIIRSQLLDYMLDKAIIPSNQHGFVPKKSTVTNLLECLNNWTYNFDHHISTHVVYLDYSKCFDKVCHSKLLYKLSQYGITGSAYMWFKNFLANRVQTVKVNNSFSSQVHVLSGVPQGTVLGPLLFYCTLQTYPVL